jgi:hypothetical protein
VALNYKENRHPNSPRQGLGDLGVHQHPQATELGSSSLLITEILWYVEVEDLVHMLGRYDAHS